MKKIILLLAFVLLKECLIDLSKVKMFGRIGDNKIGVRYENSKQDFDILYYGDIDRCSREWIELLNKIGGKK